MRPLRARRDGGVSVMVRGEIMRVGGSATVRETGGFVPGKTTPVKFYVPDVCHTFRRGIGWSFRSNRPGFLWRTEPADLCGHFKQRSRTSRIDDQGHVLAASPSGIESGCFRSPKTRLSLVPIRRDFVR